MLLQRAKEKYRARRRRVWSINLYSCYYSVHLILFENRALVVRQIEEQLSKQLSIEYMSEESDDESDALVVVVHQLTWRSKRKI